MNSQTFLFSYSQSAFANGYNAWATKTIATLPDGNQNIVYCNYAGQTKEQNVQVAAGRLGQPPVPTGLDFQYILSTLGRLNRSTHPSDRSLQSSKFDLTLSGSEHISVRRCFTIEGSDREGAIKNATKSILCCVIFFCNYVWWTDWLVGCVIPILRNESRGVSV